MNNERKVIGELIATSYSSFTAESYELNSTPPLGSLVVAQNVLGVVAQARTEGLGAISARGSAEDEDESVYRLYPDLQRTLRSQFTALVVGCYEGEGGAWPGSTAIYAYPECPPHVHYKCRMASDAELFAFTSQPDYLRLLTSSTEPVPIDQVIIHLVLRAYRARNNDREWLLYTAEYLGRQLKGQYDRLLGILKTLDTLTGAVEPAGSAAAVKDTVGKIRL